MQPAQMEAVGAWYKDFSQTTDAEVTKSPGRVRWLAARTEKGRAP